MYTFCTFTKVMQLIGVAEIYFYNRDGRDIVLSELTDIIYHKTEKKTIMEETIRKYCLVSGGLNELNQNKINIHLIVHIAVISRSYKGLLSWLDTEDVSSAKMSKVHQYHDWI